MQWSRKVFWGFILRGEKKKNLPILYFENQSIPNEAFHTLEMISTNVLRELHPKDFASQMSRAPRRFS